MVTQANIIKAIQADMKLGIVESDLYHYFLDDRTQRDGSFPSWAATLPAVDADLIRTWLLDG